MLAVGASRNEVARALSLDIETVRRFANATTVEEDSAPTLERHSKLDEFKEYLHRRWSEDTTSAVTLTGEISGQGYTDSVQTLRRYLHRFHGVRAAPPPGSMVPTVRQISRWLMTRPDRLDPRTGNAWRQSSNAGPDLTSLADHVTRFARMDEPARRPAAVGLDCRRRGRHPHPAQAFARHLRNDLAAVVNGLTLTYSSGTVEGSVNKIKTYKRQMFGRANFDLLRKRVLLE